MSRLIGCIAAGTLVSLAFLQAARTEAEDWTKPVEVTFDLKRLISFRARLSGTFLVVEAAPEPGWHTFALDNRERAIEKLQGRKPLSQDLPTEISVTRGLAVEGPWLQSPPKDLSRPELRWFSWGFVERAFFAAKVRRTGNGPASVSIRGQVCTETTCKKVDVTISLPLGSRAGPDMPDSVLESLIPVRK